MKKTITFNQLKKLVQEGRAPHRVVKPRAAAPLKETFTIHYTDNARCMNRGDGHDTIADYKFTGTLQDVLNFGAYAMNGGDIDEEMFQDACNGGSGDGDEWEILSVVDAKDSMDTADLGYGCPVVFWIKNSKGRKVYDSGLDESEWQNDDDDGGW